MYYHYVFKTYKGLYILTDKELVQELRNCFYQIADGKGFEIKELSILGDHVHMLIKQNPHDNPSYTMKMIKGISARNIFRGFKTNRLFYRKLWGRSFFAEEIKAKEIMKVKNYIKKQIKSGEDKRFSIKEPRSSFAGSLDK